MAHDAMSKQRAELFWLKANTYRLTFQIVKALHVLADHPESLTLCHAIESPILTDFGMKLISVLVQQSCDYCVRNKEERVRGRTRGAGKYTLKIPKVFARKVIIIDTYH